MTMMSKLALLGETVVSTELEKRDSFKREKDVIN